MAGGEMTYHKGGQGRGVTRMTCDHVIRYDRRDANTPLGWDMVPVMCSAEVSDGWGMTTAERLRDMGRAKGWQVRRKQGSTYVDLCPLHRIAYRNPTPYGRRR